jgi:hypothetical protein
MTAKNFNNTGQFETYLVAVLIISATLATVLFKEWFVEPSGKMELFNGLGILLAVGLILKWKYVREILSFLTAMASIVILLILMQMGFSSLPFLALFFAFGLCFYLLAFSRNLATYYRG